MRKIVVILGTVLFLSAIVATADDKPLTNDDVVAMVKAGLDSSIIIAKISQAGRSGFDTSVDGLIKLKKAGVAKEVIDAMLGVTRQATGAVAGGAPAKTDVQLLRSDGALDLESLEGEASATYIGIGFLTWLNFDGKHAAVTTKDSRVTLRLQSAQKPDSRVFIVRLDVNDADRSVKMGRSRMFSATAPTTPDREWTFPFDSVQEQDGIWKLTVKSSLPKGEYGLLRGTELYDFAVE